METPGIYRLLNTITGRSYVGSSVHPRIRGKEHIALLKRGKSHSPKLQNAWNKYGASSFVFEVLESCAREALESAEVRWILALDSVTNGYNCSHDARVPTRGLKHSPEARARMSAAQRKPRTPVQLEAARANLRAYNSSIRGRPQTEEHKQRIGRANMGKRRTEEVKQRLRGRTHSAETLAKLRGRTHSAEARHKISVAQIGRTGAAHNRSRPVAQMTTSGDVVAIFASATEAAGALGIRRESIKNCVAGRAKSGGGYCWMYA